MDAALKNYAKETKLSYVACESIHRLFLALKKSSSHEFPHNAMILSGSFSVLNESKLQCTDLQLAGKTIPIKYKICPFIISLYGYIGVVTVITAISQYECIVKHNTCPIQVRSFTFHLKAADNDKVLPGFKFQLFNHFKALPLVSIPILLLGLQST